MEEAAIWGRFRAGDRAAFHEIYERYSPQIRAFIRHYLYDRNSADDLVQETFLSVWKRPNGFDPERGTLKQYLFGIARKHAAQHRKGTILPAEQASDPQVRSTSDSTLIRLTVMKLDPDQRALLWLREVEGCSYSELAEILDIPVGTVKSRLFSAREALRLIWRGGEKNKE